MLSPILSLLFLGLTTASAVPSTADPEAYDASLGMKWRGEVLPGATMTFYGSVHQIYEQIIAVNPDYVPANLNVTRTERALQKRNKEGGNCGQYSTADQNNTNDMITMLADLGGECIVNGNSCIRMQCKNTSGIYLCNDNDFTINPQCNYIVSYAQDIYGSCGNGYPYQDCALSGQEFDTDQYNVVVAYADCNDSPSVPPSAYTPYGPNGDPYVTCQDCVVLNCGPDPPEVCTGNDK